MIERKDFPLLTNYPNLVYLDNSATTQKPSAMMEALNHFYLTSNSNVGRGIYDLAYKAEQALENSRQYIADFFHARAEGLIFTSGATDSLNQAAYILSQDIKPGDVIVVTIWDHHANILPWQNIAKEKGAEVKFIEDIKEIYNPETIKEKFWDRVKIVAMPHVTNTTGNIFPVEKWAKFLRKKNIVSVIDGAQAVSSIEVNISEIDADFYAFSAHKLYGPMGLGCLFISNKKFFKYSPLFLGGGIIEDVSKGGYILKDSSDKFEAGTPDVANAYAFAETLKWLKDNNWENNLKEIKAYNLALIEFAKNCHLVTLLTDIKYPHIAMTTLTVKDIHSHDIGTFLSNKGIAVRVGKHCAYPLHSFLQQKHSVRFSLGIYNTKEEVEHSILSMTQALSYF